MTRIEPIDPAHALGKVKALLDGVQRKRGFVPTLMRLLAHSPAALDGYLCSGGALENATLSTQIREQIAIAVSERNGCACCVTNHVRFGREAGLSDSELDAARDSTSADPAVAEALGFARALLETGGHVSDAQFAAAQAAGFDNAAIVEITAVVARTLFANFVNNLGQSLPDCPI